MVAMDGVAHGYKGIYSTGEMNSHRRVPLQNLAIPAAPMGLNDNVGGPLSSTPH